MNDNEIIKALEYCVTSKCGDCPIFYNDEVRRVPGRCVVTLEKNALDLINRQQAEIEKFKKFKKIETTVNGFWEGIQKLAMFKDKEMPTLEELLEYMDNLKTEAIKELLDKIEKQAIPNEDDVYWVELDDIYNLVKEMVGDTE